MAVDKIRPGKNAEPVNPLTLKPARQIGDVLGKVLDLVDEAARFIGFDEGGDSWLLQRGAQFFEVLGTSQEREFAVVTHSHGEMGLTDLAVQPILAL